MNVGRFCLASAALFIVATLWNGVLHMVLLRNTDTSIAHLRRPDRRETMRVAALLTACLVLLFVFAYRRVARSGSLVEALGYGLFSLCWPGGSLISISSSKTSYRHRSP